MERVVFEVLKVDKSVLIIYYIGSVVHKLFQYFRHIGEGIVKNSAEEEKGAEKLEKEFRREQESKNRPPKAAGFLILL